MKIGKSQKLTMILSLAKMDLRPQKPGNLKIKILDLEINQSDKKNNNLYKKLYIDI